MLKFARLALKISRSFVTLKQFQKLQQIKKNRKAQALILKSDLFQKAFPLIKEFLVGKNCPGCGASFQIDDNTRYGYVSPQRFLKYNDLIGKVQQNQQGIQQQQQFINQTSTEVTEVSKLKRKEKSKQNQQLNCARCFSLKHYNKLPDQFNKIRQQQLAKLRQPQERQVEQLLAKFKKNRCLIIVIDAFDLGSLPIKAIKRCQHNNQKIIILLNKIDVLAKKYLSISAIKRDVIKRIWPDKDPESNDLILLSAVSKQGIGRLKDILAKIKKEDDLYHFYFMGATNVGKSTIINSLIRLSQSQRQKSHRAQASQPHAKQITDSQKQLTESPVPGTTLQIIKLQNKQLNLWFYDTPGLIIQSQFYFSFCQNNAMRLLPAKKQVTPKILQLARQLTLLLGTFVRLETESEQKVLVFISQHISVQICERLTANQFFLKQHGILLKPMLNSEIQSLQFQLKQIQIEGPTDLEFYGLGFVSLTGEDQRSIRFWIPRGRGYGTRRSVVREDLFRQERISFSKGKYVPATRLIKQQQSDHNK